VSGGLVPLQEPIHLPPFLENDTGSSTMSITLIHFRIQTVTSRRPPLQLPFRGISCKRA
jgi:hypothetical protein